MPPPRKKDTGYIVSEQHHWDIQTLENNKWTHYWGVSTWTKNRRLALKKAAKCLATWKANTKGRWRLVYRSVDEFPHREFYVSNLE